jgi:hypothetical protein
MAEMKTLDEIIKMLEDAIDTTDVDCSMFCLFEDDIIDIIYYLKEYRKHLAQEYDELRQKNMNWNLI